MKRYLLLLLAAASLVSCNKFLDTKPTGSIVPINAYASEAQINAALSGIYTDLKYGISYAQWYTSAYSACTDESYYYLSTPSVGFAVYAASASDGASGNPSNMWNACFRSINYANSLLDNIDVSAAGKVSADIIRRAKGEALFMRGFYYFLLAQWWGDVPLQLHATSDPLQGQIARTPQKEVYDAIIKDMTEADTLLYDRTFSSLGYADRATRGAVQAMLARVCLYAAGEPVNDRTRYQDALKWSQKLISSGEYSLLSSYPQVFIDEARNIYNRENIFEIGGIRNATGVVSSELATGIYVGNPLTITTGNSPTLGALYDSGYVNGYTRIHPRLYMKYEPGDYRRDWNIGNFTQNNTAEVAYSTPDLAISALGARGVGAKFPVASNILWGRWPGKWKREYEPAVSRSTRTGNSTNYPVIRYADVLLMYAEAENEVNGATAAAYEALNKVRRRAFSTTKVVDSLSFVIGTGYTSLPNVTYTRGDGSGFTFNVIYNRNTPTAAGTIQVLLTGQGRGFSSVAPTITIGNAWNANTAYTVGTQVAAPNGNLYTVKTAGSSNATAPVHLTGDSPASTTGIVFTYAGVAAKAVAYLSETPVVDYDPGVLSAKGIDFKTALQDERSRELCFESLRRQDLKRWGILVSTIKSLELDIMGNNPAYSRIHAIESEITGNSSALPLSPVQNISNRDLYFPIPTRELLYNQKLVQNFGY